ncbi:platelet-derived growth factor subunit A [Nilaparvata lugens]|uniref:platelet-derived growth factor subunit A n=1 Tax=Nilaparvata lugens TaxID=108931 RepID=UPI00193DA74C|nr:platelet-derived growth factor subunit A [Nilaparvata lugens]
MTDLMIDSPEEDSPTISLELAQQLSNIQSMEDFYKTFNIQQEENENAPEENSTVPFSSTVIGVLSSDKYPINSTSGSDPRSKVLVKRSTDAVARAPEFAQCKPELQAVQISNSITGRELRKPDCIKIERCTGCSQQMSMSCQPTKTENVKVEVHVFSLDGRGRPHKPKGKQIVHVERHLECKVMCNVKQHHCTEKQDFDADNCSCVCKNIDEKEKCLRDSRVKEWNKKKCACQCKTVPECGEAEYFNNLTCSCDPIESKGIEFELASNDGNRHDYHYYKVR